MCIWINTILPVRYENFLSVVPYLYLRTSSLHFIESFVWFLVYAWIWQVIVSSNYKVGFFSVLDCLCQDPSVPFPANLWSFFSIATTGFGNKKGRKWYISDSPEICFASKYTLTIFTLSLLIFDTYFNYPVVTQSYHQKYWHHQLKLVFNMYQCTGV